MTNRERQHQEYIDNYLGKKILILHAEGCPQLNGLTGIVDHIDDMNQIFGTWGSLGVQPDYGDIIELVEESKDIELESLTDEQKEKEFVDALKTYCDKAGVDLESYPFHERLADAYIDNFDFYYYNDDGSRLYLNLELYYNILKEVVYVFGDYFGTNPAWDYISSKIPSYFYMSIDKMIGFLESGGDLSMILPELNKNGAKLYSYHYPEKDIELESFDNDYIKVTSLDQLKDLIIEQGYNGGTLLKAKLVQDHRIAVDDDIYYNKKDYYNYYTIKDDDGSNISYARAGTPVYFDLVNNIITYGDGDEESYYRLNDLKYLVSVYSPMYLSIIPFKNEKDIELESLEYNEGEFYVKRDGQLIADNLSFLEDGDITLSSIDDELEIGIVDPPKGITEEQFNTIVNYLEDNKDYFNEVSVHIWAEDEDDDSNDSYEHFTSNNVLLKFLRKFLILKDIELEELDPKQSVKVYYFITKDDDSFSHPEFSIEEAFDWLIGNWPGGNSIEYDPKEWPYLLVEYTYVYNNCYEDASTYVYEDEPDAYEELAKFNSWDEIEDYYNSHFIKDIELE